MSMRIKTRLFITAMLPLLMGSILSGVIYYENLDTLQNTRHQEEIRHISHGFFELNLLDAQYTYEELRARAGAQWQQRYRSLGELLRQAELNDPEGNDLLTRLQQAYASVGILFNARVGLFGEPQPVASDIQSRQTLLMFSGQLHGKLQESLAYTERLLTLLHLRGSEQQRFRHRLIYSLVGVVTLLGLGLTYLINGHIVQSVLRLRQGAELLGTGALEHRINLDSGDELGQLSTAFNHMGQQLQHSHRQLEAHIAELTAANRELASFTYAISHNFRAPIRAISGFTFVLSEEYGERLDAGGRKHIEEIQNGCREMEQMIDGFLKLTRATSEGITSRQVNLSQLARTILEAHRARQPERTVAWEITPRLVACGDPRLLRDLLEILLDNAWKFTQEIPSARIAFGASMQNGEQVHWVRDNGVGFDMAYADKLFQPFQRLHGSREFPGLSLNLAIAQRIVARHGGRIWGQGEVGKGATFYFTLAGGSANDDR